MGRSDTRLPREDHERLAEAFALINRMGMRRMLESEALDRVAVLVRELQASAAARGPVADPRIALSDAERQPKRDEFIATFEGFCEDWKRIESLEDIANSFWAELLRPADLLPYANYPNPELARAVRAACTDLARYHGLPAPSFPSPTEPQGPDGSSAHGA
jgi:hypothetical protein